MHMDLSQVGVVLLTLLLVTLSVWASVTDVRRREIPNLACVLIAACGLVLQAVCVWGDLTAWAPFAAWGAGVLLVGVACEFALRAFVGHTGFGLGDVKFTAAWACALGWAAVPALALACLLGAACALIRKTPTFPLAPWLTFAFAVALLISGK